MHLYLTTELIVNGYESRSNRLANGALSPFWYFFGEHRFTVLEGGQKGVKSKLIIEELPFGQTVRKVMALIPGLIIGVAARALSLTDPKIRDAFNLAARLS